jgi:hypothetical protein
MMRAGDGGEDESSSYPGRFLLVTTLLALGLNGCTDPSGEAPEVGPTASTSETSTASVPDEGPVQPGTYRVPESSWSVTDFTVTFPAGWQVQYGHVYSKHEDQNDELGFYPVVVEEIYDDPCRGEGVPIDVGPGPGALEAALQRLPGVSVSSPVQTTLGDHPATRVDLKIDEDLNLAACRLGQIGLQVWYSVPADKYFVLLADAQASVYILDLDGRRQVFLAQHRSAASRKDLNEMQTVLDAIQIG